MQQQPTKRHPASSVGPRPRNLSRDSHASANEDTSNSSDSKLSPIKPHPAFPGKKFLDLKRWECVPRPQYTRSCGITSVVACWNYLFSILGQGKLPYLTVPQALRILGYTQEIRRIPFFDIAINRNIMRWFRKLCTHFGVKGEARIYWKNSHERKSEDVLRTYCEDIQSAGKAFIYHCFKHYITPVGFETSGSLEDSWMLIGESSRGYPSLHVVPWKDVAADIMCKNSLVYNIRQRYKGVQKNPEKKNHHRLILLQRLDN